MIEILLYMSFGIIIICYLIYLFLLLFNRKNIISKSSGFDVCKDIISEYNSINVIESKNYVSYYNLKRKVIKLSNKTYYSMDLTSITISLIEAGISILDNNCNKIINLYKKIINNIKIFYFLPILSLVIGNIFYSLYDIKIGIVLVMLFSLILFSMIDIKTKIYNWLCDDLKNIKDITKENRDKVMNFINIIIIIDKFLLLGQVLIIFRFIMILLGFN